MRSILSLLLLALSGCGSDDSPVLARLGDNQITAADLERFVARLPKTIRSTEKGREADLDHLNSAIDHQMLMAEALSRGLHEDEAFLYDFGQAFQGRMAQLYEFRAIGPQVEVTEEDIERIFKETGLDRERRLRRVVVHSETEAEQVAKELNSGSPFEEMAQRFAANDKLTGDGELGWMSLADTRRWAIQRRIFTSLPTGKFAVNKISPQLWQVIQFVEDREADLFNYRERVERAAYQQKVWLEKQEEVELLTHKYGVRLMPGLHVLIGHENLQKIELTAEQAQQPFYSFKGGHIDAGECLQGLKVIGRHIPLEDSAQVVDLADRVVLHMWLFAAAARDEGWEEEEELIAWRQRKHDELLVKRLMKHEVDDQLDIGDADVRAYYDAERERFRASEEVVVREVYTADEAEAKEWRQLLEANTTVPELLSRKDVYTHGESELGGELRVHKIRAGAMPELIEPTFAAQEGELVGPVWVKHHKAYSLLRVVERIASYIRPFEKVEPQARYLITEQRRQELTIALIRSLRDKYEDRIEIFEERLG